MVTVLQKKFASEMNLGRLWLAYTELQSDCTCYNSYLLILDYKGAEVQ